MYRCPIPEQLADRIVPPDESHYVATIPAGSATPRPRVVRGLCLSGESVIDNETMVEELRLRTVKEFGKDVIAIEMEAAGIAAACQRYATRFLILKSIADFAAAKSDLWQPCAAAVSVSAAIRWVRQLQKSDVHQLQEPTYDDLSPDRFERAKQVARLVGGILPCRGVSFGDVTDRDIDDFITQYDLLSEKFVHAALGEADVGFIGEEVEEYNEKHVRVPTGKVWIVDPVDGTQNLVAGRPEVAISIALFDGGQPHIAVVYMPYRDLLVAAERTHSLEVNDLPWTPRRDIVNTLDAAVVALPGDLRRLRDTPAAPLVAAISERAASVRITGALAYDLASLAMGEIDARLSTSAKLVDVAAGVLLVSRAGGVVTDLAGNPWTPASATILASRSHNLHMQLLEITSTSLL